MECCGNILEGEFISPGERNMERMVIGKGFTEERVSNSLKNEHVGLKDIQGWGKTMKKDKEAWKCLMSLMEAITEILWISCLKLVDGQHCYLWRSVASPYTTLLLDHSGSSSSNFYISVSPSCPPKVKLSEQQTFKHRQLLFPLFSTHQGHQIQKKKKMSRSYKGPAMMFIHSLVPKARDYWNFVTFLDRNDFWNCLYHWWVRASILFEKHTVQLIFPWNSFRQIKKKKSANLCNPFHQTPLRTICRSFPKC